MININQHKKTKKITYIGFSILSKVVRLKLQSALGPQFP